MPEIEVLSPHLADLIAAGDITDMLPTGCPEGTTMIVRDLFYNTPARLKFLKSDRSEASACQLTALRIIGCGGRRNKFSFSLDRIAFRINVHVYR